MVKQKILVVDDEQGVRLTVSRMLEDDFVVLEAADGEQAIAMAREEMPSIILMDLMMPKLDGYAACLSIKSDQDTRRIPVVMLTAIGHELNKRFAEEMGADGYITKPFTRESLQKEVRRLLPSAGENVRGIHPD
ncbi:MAG: response regulator [Dehalococcoidia bacterium]